MSALAQDSLSVFDDGEEVAGFILYTLLDADHPQPAPIAIPAGLDWSTRGFILEGDAWTVYGWDVVVHAWPDPERFDLAISELLQEAVDQGAVVAWIGTEGNPFADPPHLFSPKWMRGSVITAKTSDRRTFGHLNLDQPVSTLDDADLESLRTHAAGLADADE